MTPYALGALVQYKPDHPGDIWDTTQPYEVVGRMTREWLTRATEVWYTLMLHTVDRDYWVSRPISLVRPDQLSSWPLPRCEHCGTELPLGRTPTPTPEACHECTVWWMHLSAAAHEEP